MRNKAFGIPVAAAAGFIGCGVLAVWQQQPAYFFLPALCLLLLLLLCHLRAGWYLLLATLAFSAEVQLGSLGTDIPDEPLMALLSLAAIGVMPGGRYATAKPLLKHPVFFIIVLQLAWAFVSASFSTHPLLSFKYFLAKTWYILPFVVLPFFFVTGKQAIKQVAWCICLPLVPVVLIIVVRHGQTGFLFDDINNAVTPFFRNHVNYAAFLVCLLPVVYYAHRYTKPGLLRKAPGAVLLIFIAALFFSFSRGAWLALAAGIASAWCLKRKCLPQVVAVVLLLLVAAAGWLAANNRYLDYHHNYKKTIYHANFADHMTATFRNQDMSNAERVYRWIAGIRMSGEHPVTGFGPNTFYYNYKPYTVSYFSTWVSDNKEQSTVHNYLLLLLTEQGVPGLLLFVALLFVMLARMQRLYHRLQDVFYKTVTLCIAVILCMILVLNLLSDLVETDKIGSLFYLCAGLLIVVEHKEHLGISAE